MVAHGWKAIKVKVGQDPRADAERLRAVRQAIGPDVFLSVDANGGYTVDQAVWAAKQFEKVEVALFEQPTRAATTRAWPRCRSAVAACRSWPTRAASPPRTCWRSSPTAAADVLSLYPGKHGGVRATQHLAAMAEAAGIVCTIGSNLEREVATAAMAHVAVATPNIVCERFPGDLIGPLYFEKPLLTPLGTGRPADRAGGAGAERPPTGPGLGVQLAADGGTK